VKPTHLSRCNLATPVPSDWIRRWLPVAHSGANLLDWACGNGRHSIYGLGLGYQVLALDINVSESKTDYPAIDWRQMDLENSDIALPLKMQFDVIVVTNYLYRSRLNFLLQLLAPGGLLLYETFAVGNEAFGRPKNPDFLLQAGELFDLCRRHHLHVLGYEDGVTLSPSRVQRVAARRLPSFDRATPAADYLLLK
jgi:SAM-dependent methyltransferase